MNRSRPARPGEAPAPGLASSAGGLYLDEDLSGRGGMRPTQASHDNGYGSDDFASKRGHRTICGIARRTFWIILAILILILVILAAVLGGVLGSRATKLSSGSGSQTPENQPQDVPAIFASSNIAATTTIYQSTGSAGSRVVFYQDGYGALMGSLWSDSKNWTSVNISAVFAAASMPLVIKQGTPLAAVAAIQRSNVPQVNVYFLSPDNYVTEIVTSDYNLQSWTWGSIGPLLKYRKQAAAGSHLAAAWQDCNGNTTAVCTNGPYALIYQGANKQLNLTLSTDWSVDYGVSSSASSNSSLALLSVPVGHTWPYGDDLWAFYDSGGQLGGSFPQDNTTIWARGEAILDGRTSTGQQTMAITMLPGSNQDVILIASLSANSSLSLSVCSGVLYGASGFSAPFPAQLTQSANLSSIAMTLDQRFYGISQGEILEYSISGSSPAYKFTFIEKVPTPKLINSSTTA